MSEEPVMTGTPRVYAAIAGVMNDLAKAGISKSRKNVQQGYNFRGIDEVYNALSPMLANNGLVIIPSFANREVVERVSAKGGALFYVTLAGTFKLVATSDGSEVVAGPFFGEAMDSGDKATNKAMSAAFKYMAMEVFCIPTEGDNDADNTTHEVTIDQSHLKPERRQPIDVFEALPDDAKTITREWALEVIALMGDESRTQPERVDMATKFVMEKTNDGTDQEGLQALSSQLESYVRNPIKERMKQIRHERLVAGVTSGAAKPTPADLASQA